MDEVMKELENINEQVKDNMRELRYIIAEQKKQGQRQEKNDQCHLDMKSSINDIKLDVTKLNGDLIPIKKVVWVTLLAMVTGIIGALLTVLFR